MMKPDTQWQRAHAPKMSSVAEAIGELRPGQNILIGSGAAEPVDLVNGLVRFGGHLSGNRIFHIMTLGPAPYVEPSLHSRFRHSAFFIGANVRSAVQSGRADYIPVFLSEIPELIRSGRIRIDVALIQVSRPDVYGNVSLGVSVDVIRAAIETAGLVVAEVNCQMPYTFGDSVFPASKIHRMIPTDAQLPELQCDATNEVARDIGRQVATLIPDGATMQIGIGAMPDAVLQQLLGHRDLGVHTEMLSDGVMNLAKAGVITGRRKTLLPEKIVTSFVMGTKALYDWVDENASVEMRTSDFTNDPSVIARNDNMVSINSALAVDLTGQVAADTLHGKFYSGIGGQVDFIRGSARSRGGKAIIAFPSTAKGDSVSRIECAFEAGAGIVTTRGDVRFVVTEYGIADLWGKPIAERVEALVRIAHPKFRGQLLDQALQRGYVAKNELGRLLGVCQGT
jgi:acyl-CoA hydrolase